MHTGPDAFEYRQILRTDRCVSYVHKLIMHRKTKNYRISQQTQFLDIPMTRYNIMSLTDGEISIHDSL